MAKFWSQNIQFWIVLLADLSYRPIVIDCAVFLLGTDGLGEALVLMVGRSVWQTSQNSYLILDYNTVYQFAIFPSYSRSDKNPTIYLRQSLN